MSILMKRILKITFWILFIAADTVGLMSLSNSVQKGQYTVEAEQLEAVIEFGEEINFEEIKIVDNRLFGLVETTLTPDMIVSIDDTDTAGQKKIVFEHNNKQFTVVFNIKYKVEFYAYGELIDTQMVVTESDISFPVPTPKGGYDFSGWDYDFSKGISDNVQVNATFTEIEYPKLEALNATYGDTLADVTLPSNDRGRWEFFDPNDPSFNPANVTIGNAGNNSHRVRFHYYDNPSFYLYDSVTIKVQKKQLEFTDVVTEFVYDAEAHFPSYKLSEDVKVNVIGSAKTNAGIYDYRFEIEDDNYFGSLEGTFEIKKPDVTVTVSSAEISYPNPVPEFTFTVEGFDNPSILGIEIVRPQFATVGTHTVGITYTNQNVNYIIHSGILIVNKGDRDMPVPEFDTVEYATLLEDIALPENDFGEWYWADPKASINSMDTVSAVLKFRHYDSSYNELEKLVTFTDIVKRKLDIKVLENVYTYTPGVSRAVIYKLVDKVHPEWDYSSVTVEGNVTKTFAGYYSVNLKIVSDNYEGEIVTALDIQKDDPDIEFLESFDTEWVEGLTLGSFALPDGYTWDNANEVPKIGLHNYAVTYTPDDTDNYNVLHGTFTVIVDKAPAQIAGIKELYTKDYDTKEFDVRSLITKQFTDGVLTVTYYKNGEKVDEMVNQGDYHVVIELTEGSNYLGFTKTVTAKISPIKNEQIIADNRTATYEDLTSTLPLPKGIEGEWSWKEETVGPADTHTITAVFTPDENGNYEYREVEITITVSKKPIPVPVVYTTKEFIDDDIDTGLKDTDYYTVDGDIVAKNAGNYSATVTLIDPYNCEWLGREDEITIEFEYEITKAYIGWTTEPSGIEKTYDGSAAELIAVPKFGNKVILYINTVTKEESTTAPTEPGTYEAIVTVTYPNYKDMVEKRTIVIKKIVVSVPDVLTGSLSYNGTEQSVQLGEEVENPDYTKTYVNGTDAGDVVSVTLTLPSSTYYEWAQHSWTVVSATEIKISFTIAKISPTFESDTSIDKTTWSYSDEEGVLSVGVLKEEYEFLKDYVKLYWINGDEIVEIESLADLPRTIDQFITESEVSYLNAGTYKFYTKLEGTENWDELTGQVITITVNKAVPNDVDIVWKGALYNEATGYYKNTMGGAITSYVVYYNGKQIDATLVSATIVGTTFMGLDTKYTCVITVADTDNYESCTFDKSVPYVVVATIYGSDGALKAEYGSIEDALAKAVSGDEVWVAADNTGNIQIRKSCTVNVGVKLILPYVYNGVVETNTIEADGSVKAVFNSSGATALPKEATYCSTKVVIYNSITLTVKGELIISGQLNAGGGNKELGGHTSRYHARLYTNKKAKLIITETGTLRLLGYIHDKSSSNSETNMGKVYMYGRLYLPMVLRDYKGGEVTTAAYKGMSQYAFSPFNEIQFLNIYRSKLYIYSDAKVYGYANLYANKVINTSLASLVGPDSSFFITLHEGAELRSRYYASSATSIAGINTLDFYGGATTNEFSLSVAGQTATSAMFTFPIAWTFNINLKPLNADTTAVYNMMQDYKLLPGATITVDEGVRLNIKSLAVYEVFNDEISMSSAKYPADKAPAKLTVNGTLVAGTLGGKVYTTNTTGKVIVKATGSTTSKTYEISAIEGDYFFAEVSVYQEMVWNLELCIVDSETEEVTETITGITGIEYYTVDGLWQIPSYFEITVGEGYTVTTSEWLVVDENGIVTMVTAGEERTFTEGEVLYLSTDGANVTYTLLSTDYVIFKDGMSATLSECGQSVTQVINSPLSVKKVPKLNVTNSINNKHTMTLVDANLDGVCELDIDFAIEGSCTNWLITYRHNNPSSNFKVTVNGVEKESTAVMCSNHSDKVLKYTFGEVLYADENGEITVTIEKT